MSPSPFIAVDWGTSNCRVALVRDNACVEWIDSLPGARDLSQLDFAPRADRIRQTLGDLPMLLSGMVGSTIGWKLAPYCPVPASLHSIVGRLSWIDERTAIVPGVSQNLVDRPDVMRGEEVQILGAASQLGCAIDGVFCQPGTHSKWAQLQDGQIASFSTVMTGELFDLLGSHSVLAHSLGREVVPDGSFRRGLSDARDGDLAGKLFRIRAGSLLLDWPVAKATAYASGLLIGSECADRTRQFDNSTIHLIADAGLATLYQVAITSLGKRVELISARDAFVAGMARIAQQVFSSRG